MDNVKRNFILSVLVLLIGSAPVLAASEKEWQDAWNEAFAHGQTEVSVEFGKVNILTDTYAIEVEHVYKFHKGIGQALQYAYETGKKPALALYMDDEGDTPEKYLYALKLCRHLGIKVWLLNTAVNPNPGMKLIEEPKAVPKKRVLEPCTLIWVTDGDTIKVTWREKETFIRMLRINTPEKQKYGYKRATATLRSYMKGKNLFIELEDPEKPVTDRFKRVLAYVYAEDKNINVEMVRSGWTYYWTKFGAGKYEKQFRKAEREAKENGRGLWKWKKK